MPLRNTAVSVRLKDTSLTVAVGFVGDLERISRTTLAGSASESTTGLFEMPKSCAGFDLRHRRLGFFLDIAFQIQKLAQFTQRPTAKNDVIS